jgi:hypothetical protein
MLRYCVKITEKDIICLQKASTAGKDKEKDRKIKVFRGRLEI